MGCAVSTKDINQEQLTFDIDEFNNENEQAILEIHSHVEPKALLLRTQQIIHIDQADDSFYIYNKTPENTIPTTYSSYSALTSKKSCLKQTSHFGQSFKKSKEKNVHFDNQIKVIFGNKAFLFRTVKKTKKKCSKINLDEIF
ncbi:unnamed protein product [Paramecium sonneborni]|uniref:Uncharacterized protein n=1 Tax=Paramecium sonneborni TaxID=65129 RepID=A0A8S1RKW6_9CILI|nr:unnamed protein product [Paramecium sonneborni]